MGANKYYFLCSVRILLLALVIFAGAGIEMNEGIAHAGAYSYLRTQNGGKLAERQLFIKTTRPSVIFTFGGFTKTAPLEDILQKLSANGMRGTFFVNERELKRYRGNLDMIASYGQDMGIGLRSEEGYGFEDYCRQIEEIRAFLSENYGIEPVACRLITGPDSEALQEAVSAEGLVLCGQGLNVVQSKHKDAVSPDEVMPQIFGRLMFSLARGEIVYLRTDFYTNELLAGEMLMEIKKQKIDNIAYRTLTDTPEINPMNDSAYAVEDVRTVLEDRARLWEYPKPWQVPAHLHPEYRSFDLTRENFEKEFFKRYIGSPLVNEDDRMTGFSRRQMNKADQTGTIHTVTDNTIFLSFDDWSQDNSINHLLYVLRKHRVPATFFIITWNMPNNPNLLRAIAEEGHEIGSHTDRHKAMNMRNAKGKQVAVLSDAAFDADVREGYKKLYETVGDVFVDGRYSLTRFIRPPTLAISKSGAYSLFDTGFEFIVSGYESTEDYAQESLEALVGAFHDGIYMKNGKVRQGSILIMHMSYTARYTAQALDILLTANERRLDSDPLKFKVGYLADYLTEDYDENKPNVPLRRVR